MTVINSRITGNIFDIQRFSLNDGPGIRTVVFLKGCPLHCWWCSNPESQRRHPVVMYKAEACRSCGLCEKACTNKAITFDASGVRKADLELCTGLGDCVKVCSQGALMMKGTTIGVEELMDILKKESSVFRYSKGGVTLSGGDPLMQPNFAKAILKRCKAQGWNTAVETEGCGDTEDFLDIANYTDHILFDIKHMEPEKHQLFTGVSNALILHNARELAKVAPLIIRIPVIPKFNHSMQEISEIVDFAISLGNVRYLHLLPYHNLAGQKYKMLGMEDKMQRLSVEPLANEDLEVYRTMIASKGLLCRLGDEDDQEN